MTMTETTGRRTQDLAFSHWHRRVFPSNFSAFDVDYSAWCENSGARCRRPLTLLEIGRDNGREKHGTMIDALAAPRDYWIPAWVVLFRRNFDVASDHPEAIHSFRVRHPAHPYQWVEMSRDEFAVFLRESRAEGVRRSNCNRGCR
jgi:hypothetical protein